MKDSKNDITPAASALDASLKDRLNRRQFFARSASAAAGGTLLHSGLFAGLVARSARADHDLRDRTGYGPLVPAGPELELPRGFRYAIISKEGEEMTDGYPTPKAMDGMAAFPLRNGNIALVRNHEDAEQPSRLRPRPMGSTSTSAGILNNRLLTHYGPRTYAYDAYVGGGCTTLEYNPRRRRVVREFWSLVGTFRNCAGGTTPWGSWLSCEETFEPAAPTGAAQNHGYVFEVPSTTTPGHPADPIPLRQLGRMAHEAAAVDPATGIIYETEDQGDVSGFYRFVPDIRPTRPGDLARTTGRLQMLKVNTANGYETAINQRVGVALPTSWVDVPDPDPTPPTVTVDGVTAAAIFKQGFDAGGARFRRLEGIWYAAGKIFFDSTNGGNWGFGQIWVYDPVAETLTLLFESDSADRLDAPDNLALSPRGGIIIAEDNGGAQYLRGISPSGELFDFARNLHNTLEFAGACFSPDGQTMFVNLYGRATVRTTQPYKSPVLIPIPSEERELALTIAIWGPWGSGLL
ncbi:MAG TPA: alkaline phosphatase PhoX [Blastocatellia bacterium]|nr:alkaline phosphatase PhoX [Blastocatellia bacterium]